MKIDDACRSVLQAREACAHDAVLVSTMSAMFAFDALGETRRRIDSVPLMGGAAGLALGLALAQPRLPVIAVDGDASLLMELGGLVTVAHAQPQHLVHLVINNHVQFGGVVNMPRPGALEPACDFVAIAAAAGYAAASRVDTAQDLSDALRRALSSPGLFFIEVIVEPDAPIMGEGCPQPFMPDRQFERMRDAVPRLRSELGVVCG